MATTKDTADFILSALGSRFTTRKMFGEYGVYADGKIVALIADDQFYVKICPASAVLETMCEKDAPYPGAKPYYLIDEALITDRDEVNLPAILIQIAASLPEKKPKKKSK